MSVSVINFARGIKDSFQRMPADRCLKANETYLVRDSPDSGTQTVMYGSKILGQLDGSEIFVRPSGRSK